MSTSPVESIRFAGDVNIRRLEIVSSANYKVDVTNQLIGIEIYEDMFSPFTSMAITIRESQDFINALPLRGEEIINLEISTPTFKNDDTFFKGKYYIYKISDRQTLTDRNTAYTLNCISYEALYDLNVKASKAYRGNVADIAKELMGKDGLNTTKKTNIQPTNNSTKFVANFWSPVKSLNFLATGAISKENSPTYLFYENRYGLNFLSVESLYSQQTYQKFIKDNYSRDTNGNTSSRNVERDYQRILDIKVRVPFDSLKSISAGAHASRQFSYDIVRKKYFAKDYNALSNFKNGAHLNKNPLYTDMRPIAPTNYIYNDVKHYSNHNGFADTNGVKVKQERNSKLALLRSCVIEINVFGRTDYTVGQKVYVELPKPTVLTEKDQANTNRQTGFIDTAYSGNYIVTAINHVISRDKHTCIMELSKESMVE
jgi:hypothetical protein